MVLDLFNGGDDGVGCITTGGTESILVAMRAYRERGRAKGIRRANIVVPVSAHAAFWKAANYFDMDLIEAPLDSNFQVDVAKLERLINSNTVAIVGSAPCFPQGTLDPIESLGKIAHKRDIGLHVDSCLGGLLLPFIAQFSKVPLFDFRVQGVTSISADTHKYGYSLKGSSVIMYKNQDLMHFQYFVAQDWTGGIYASPSIMGSRVGGAVAATWAALMSIGRGGYIDLAKKIFKTTQAIEKGIKDIDGLRVLGVPVSSVVSFAVDNTAAGKQLNIYKINEAMISKGWHLNTLQHPASIHLCCTVLHTDKEEIFLRDLKASVTDVLQHPNKFAGGDAVIYGLAESLPDSRLLVPGVECFLDCLSQTGPKYAPKN